MKKLLIAALLFSGLNIKAQHDISTDVLGFAFSKYGLGYEYAINSNNSVGINFNMAAKNMLSDTKDMNGEIDYSEMNIIPEYKYFMTPNKGNDGIYIGVYGKYRSSSSKGVEYSYYDISTPTTETKVKTDITSSGMSLGAMAGYKWKTSGALFMEVTAGIGKFIMNDVKYSNADFEEGTKDGFGTFKTEYKEFDENNYVPFFGNELAVDLRLAVKIGIRIGGKSE
ncbi:MAG: DUF3575 domain-containing protein [Flavobacteriales bacterium]|nr:DUF3575 domain-containing protein [Flavobacteriales bacterium]